METLKANSLPTILRKIEVLLIL